MAEQEGLSDSSEFPEDFISLKRPIAKFEVNLILSAHMQGIDIV